jgi:septum formation protein
MERRLLLASTSPRRHELLRAAGIAFELHPPGAEPPGEGSPEERARLRARQKALDAPLPAVPAGILGVDTVVAVGAREFGKPSDREDAARMLRALSGGEHRVLTAHCLVRLPERVIAEQLAVARVACAVLDERQIDAYLDSGEWRGKAGAYGIQGQAAAFLRLVEGELDTVIGLHVAAVRALLAGPEGP